MKELQEKLGQETKYSKYYLLIIEKAKLENRKKYTKDNKNYVYYENHHILPRSLFPDYSNLKDNPWNGVLLTAKEHYICHALIWKHYKKLKSVNNCYKMFNAFKRMNKQSNNKIIYNSNLYNICKSKCYIHHIYNSNDELVYTVNGDLKTFCDDNNLPNLFIESGRRDGYPLFMMPESITKATKSGYKDYIGWYCLRNNRLQKEEYKKENYKEVINNKLLLRVKIGKEYNKSLSEEEAKRLASLTSHKGIDNSSFCKRTIYIPKLVKIIRFDENSYPSNFREFLDYHNLPNGLRKSATNGGKPLYTSKCGVKNANNKGYIDYIGSYCLRDGEVQLDKWKNYNTLYKESENTHKEGINKRNITLKDVMIDTKIYGSNGSKHPLFRKRKIIIPLINKEIIFDGTTCGSFKDFLKMNNLPASLSKLENTNESYTNRFTNKNNQVKYGYLEGATVIQIID